MTDRSVINIRRYNLTPKPKSEEKRNRIITAAINTFSKYGLEKGTIATIAKEADIGKGTVYQYFQSKEEIFENIIYIIFDGLLHAWKEIIESDISPLKKIEIMLDYTVDITDQWMNSESKDQMAMLMEIFLYSFRNQNKINMDQVLKNIYKLIEPVIEEGVKEGVFKTVDADYLGFILFSFLDGFALHFFFQIQNYDHEKLKNSMKNLLLNGLLIKQGDTI